MRVRQRVYGDRGSTFAQWLALGVLAALILAGLTPLVGQALGDGISRVICEIVNGGDASKCPTTPPGAESPGKIDINPQWCLSSMHADDSHVGLSWMIFNIGEGYKVIRYDSREEDIDGKVKHYVYLAFVNKGDVGIDLGKASAGNKKIDLGGGEYVNYGDMYRLTPEEYDKFNKQINEYQAEQLSDRMSGNPFGSLGQWVYHKIKGEDWPPKIPDPAITFGEHTEQGQGSATVPVPNLDKKLQTPNKYVLPNGASVGTTQAHTVTTEHWYIYKDPKGKILPATATYHTISGSYTVGASRTGTKNGKAGEDGPGIDGKGGASATWDYSNTTRITRDDATGKLRSIRYVITYGDQGSLTGGFGVNGSDRGKGSKRAGGGYSNTHSNGKLHTEVVQLNFDLNNPADQKVGEDWLKNHGLEMPPTVAQQIFPKTGRTPGIPDDKPTADAPGPNADPFDKMIYNKAMAWKTDAETKEQAQEFNAMLPIGKGVGIDMSLSSQDAKTLKAQILDAPGSDGERHWIDYPDCTAAGNH